MPTATKAPVIVAVDVAYSATDAVVACVVFNAWSDAEPATERVIEMPCPAPYVAGRFFERELPCVMRALAALGTAPTHLIVDGFVWLDDKAKPGLGAHAFAALGEKTIVIGVAKNPFRALPPCTAVVRGGSARPLFVSAAGVTHAAAADCVQQMHGEHRLPTLLRRVDQLSRKIATPKAL